MVPGWLGFRISMLVVLATTSNYGQLLELNPAVERQNFLPEGEDDDGR